MTASAFTALNAIQKSVTHIISQIKHF